MSSPAPDPTALSTYYAVTVYDTAPSDAPPSNPAFPEKHFRGSGKVQVWNGSDTQPGLNIITIPPEQNDVNFPGVVPNYPPWVPPGTVAVGLAPNSLSSATIAPWLSTQAQAEEYAALIPGTTMEERLDINYGAETRRVYELTYPNGIKQYGGQVIAQENSGGVGRPGHWDVSTGVPLWAADPLPTGAVLAGPVVSIPLNLPAGASLIAVPVGAGLSVVEVQLGATKVTAIGTIGGQQFTLTLG